MRPVGQEGFTLIEVLVSFVILSGAIILTFQIFSDGLLGVEVSRAKAQEVISAEQLIGQLSLRADLQAGTMIETIGDSKLRAAIEMIDNVDTKKSFLQHPFRVKIFSAEVKDAEAPILETILIAKPASQ